MFGRRIRLFSLLGFEVGVDISWILLALLITWTLAAGYFPAQNPELATATYWWMGVAGALGLFFSIIFHEFAHSLVARRYQLPITGITLFIFGGVAHMQEEPGTPRAEFLMAVAGPIASLLLAGLFYLAWRAGLSADMAAPVAGVLQYLAVINLVLALFNLVPAFPLDGGRMLRAALWGWHKDLRRASRTAAAFGGAFGILLIVLGLLSVVTGNFIGGMWWFLIGLFVRAAAGSSYQQTVMRQTLAGKTVRQLMVRDMVTVPPGITIAQLVEDYFYRSYHKLYPVVEAGRCTGSISIRNVNKVHRDDWARTPVSEIADPCDEKTSVDANMDAMTVMGRMRESGRSRLLVMDGERLAGIVTLKDIMTYLSFRMEVEEGVRTALPDDDPALARQPRAR